MKSTKGTHGSSGTPKVKNHSEEINQIYPFLTMSSAMSLKDAIILYQSSMPTFFSGLLLNYLPEDLLNYSLKKLLRLLAAVCGYMLFRNLVMRHQVLRAGREAEKRANEPESEQVEDLFNQETATLSGVQEASWGWGQTTRRDIRKKQEFLQRLQRQRDGDEDDDDDIADLLED